jgi:O-Antigen ligase
MVKSKVVNYISLGALALFLYMPFHTFLSVWLSTYTGGLDVWKVWKDVLTATVTILCIATVFWYGKASKLYKNLLILVGLYALIHIILFFTTDQPLLTGTLALVYNLRIFCYLLIGYSLALLLSAQSSKLKAQSLLNKYAKILIILSTIVCFVAVLQYLLPKDTMTHFGYAVERGVKPNFFIDDKSDLFRVFSTLKDPNSLGAFLILPITLLLHKLIKGWKTERRMLLSGLLILHVWVLLLTFSRSALLATIFSIVCLLILGNFKFIKLHKKKIIAIVAILCVVTLGFVYVLRDQYFVQNVVFHADESTTLQTPNELRSSLAQEAVDGIINQPLGHGPGTAGLVSTRLPNGLLTENYFLQIMYEVGIFGFAIFVAILFLVVQKLWTLRQNDTAKILLASFAGLLLANLFFHTFSNEAVSISWFLLAGLTLRMNTNTDIING